MLYATQLLPRGYLHTPNDMILVNIMEVIEWTWIGLQLDRQLDGQGETNIPPPNINNNNYVVQRV